MHVTPGGSHKKPNDPCFLLACGETVATRSPELLSYFALTESGTLSSCFSSVNLEPWKLILQHLWLIEHQPTQNMENIMEHLSVLPNPDSIFHVMKLTTWRATITWSHYRFDDLGCKSAVPRSGDSWRGPVPRKYTHFTRSWSSWQRAAIGFTLIGMAFYYITTWCHRAPAICYTQRALFTIWDRIVCCLDQAMWTKGKENTLVSCSFSQFSI